MYPETYSDAQQPGPLLRQLCPLWNTQPPITSPLIPVHFEGAIAEQMASSNGAEGHNKFLPISYFLETLEQT